MKLSTPITFRQSLSFLSWWINEIKGACDDVYSYLLPRWRRTINLYVSRHRIAIASDDAQSIATEIDRSQLNEPACVQPLLDELAGHSRAHVIVDPDLAFVCAVRMPLATLPHLESAIALQLPRWVPLEPALVLTDFEVVSVDRDAASFSADLAVIKKRDIQPVEDVLQRVGLEVGVVGLGRRDIGTTRFNFKSFDVGANRYAMSRTQSWLAASAFALLLGAVVMFLTQSIRAQSFLQRALSQTTAEATAVLQQRQELVSRLETLSVISESEREPTAAAVLGDVTVHLSKGAWLTTFELKGRDLRLVGLSADTSAVVEGLAGASFIGEVQLRSSTSAPSGAGKERFEITAQVKAR